MVTFCYSRVMNHITTANSKNGTFDVAYLTVVPRRPSSVRAQCLWCFGLHLGQKYARIFFHGHYMFLKARSFPRATFSEKRSVLRTDNVRGQIS